MSTEMKKPFDALVRSTLYAFSDGRLNIEEAMNRITCSVLFYTKEELDTYGYDVIQWAIDKAKTLAENKMGIKITSEEEERLKDKLLEYMKKYPGVELWRFIWAVLWELRSKE